MVGRILTLMGVGTGKNEGKELFAPHFLAQNFYPLSYRFLHKNAF